jgi:hypothetical protein
MKANSDLRAELAIFVLSAIAYGGFRFFDGNYDAERYYIRTNKVKFYSMYLTKTILYTSMVYNARYVLQKFSILSKS